MTVIAWDGQSIACDRQATYGGCRMETRKYRKLDDGSILMWCGGSAQGEMLADLYARGELHEKWPKFQETDDFATLVIAKPSEVIFYEQAPFPLKAYGPKAWGSGFKYAMAAMWCGSDAQKAVECAMHFDEGCGIGVDVFRLW